MDIKSKKSKPFAAWLCFFLGISFIVILIYSSLIIINDFSLETLQYILKGDYRNSSLFKERTNQYFTRLLSLVNEPPYQDKDRLESTEVLDEEDNNVIASTEGMLGEEGDNLRYYASNDKLALGNFKYSMTKLSLNSSNPESAPTIILPDLPAGYNYYWYFDGQKLQVIDHGKTLVLERLDNGYQSVIHNFDKYYNARNTNIQVLLAVKDSLIKNPYAISMYYQEQQLTQYIRWWFMTVGATGLLLLCIALIMRRSKKEFDHRIASWSGSIWLEFKLLISFLLLFMMLNISISIYGNGYYDIYYFIRDKAPACVLILTGLWWFYIMMVDLIINRADFFKHNIINSITNWYRQYESRYSWQQSMIKRAYLLLVIEGILALLSVYILMMAVAARDFSMPVLIAILIAAFGIYLIYRYLRHFNRTIDDLGKLIDHIALIKNGDMQSKLELSASSDMYPAAANLNALQEGMSISVTEKIKSERMKVDLITNVSHDLKTPLTSIISYVDLLGKEENLPEPVSNYIKILAQKSERLKNLIQDLFDLSKASSGNASLDMEEIDLARLIKQTLADMDERISDSGLAFRLNIPDEPVYIKSDGKKLYRVWENLITNALKYSLPSSRVFVELVVDDRQAVASIKNIARDEINFTEEEILQRFVRGDSARTTEGSGLGLSIAQSFTQICGGELAIKIDGDLFKVELRFNQTRGRFSCLPEVYMIESRKNQDEF